MDDEEKKEMFLLEKIMNYIIGNKLNSTISYMLQQHQDGLSKEVLDMIREEIKVILEGKVYSLVQCAFMADQNMWFQNLGI